MSSSISFSASSAAAYAKTAQTIHTANDQRVAVRQQLAQASLTGVYGPPYILDVSLAFAVGDEPLSGSAPTPPPTSEQTLQSNFNQLSGALQSGNISAAQQAFSSLAQIPQVQEKLQAQLTGESNDPLAQALNQVRSALQSGNIQGAQQAFAALNSGRPALKASGTTSTPKSLVIPLEALAVNTEAANPTVNIIAHPQAPAPAIPAINLNT